MCEIEKRREKETDKIFICSLGKFCFRLLVVLSRTVCLTFPSTSPFQCKVAVRRTRYFVLRSTLRCLLSRACLSTGRLSDETSAPVPRLPEQM